MERPFILGHSVYTKFIFRTKATADQCADTHDHIIFYFIHTSEETSSTKKTSRAPNIMDKMEQLTFARFDRWACRDNNKPRPRLDRFSRFERTFPVYQRRGTILCAVVLFHPTNTNIIIIRSWVFFEKKIEKKAAIFYTDKVQRRVYVIQFRVCCKIL